MKIEAALEYCIKQLFLEVGEKYPECQELIRDPQWYKKRSWTNEQEEKFKKWMVAYLRVKIKLNKKLAESTTAMFLLQYGWTNRKPLIMIAGNKSNKSNKPKEG